MSQRKANPDMALDVLRSGLSYPGGPADTARVHLALARLAAERGSWADAQASAGAGLGLVAPLAAAHATVHPSLDGDAPQLVLGAAELGVRAALLQGYDPEALAMAAQCEEAVRVGPGAAATPHRAHTHTRSLGLLTLASLAHAGAAAAAPHADRLAASLGADVAASVAAEAALGDAAAALGVARAAQGREGEAEAALAAVAATAAPRGQEGASAPGSAEHQEWHAAVARQHAREVEAEALAGRAQLQMARREWGGAEELLGAALGAAEAAHGERSPCLAPLLTLLGYAYCRSGRVTLGEGLLREAAKLLRLDPLHAGGGGGGGNGGGGGAAPPRLAACAGVHSSVGAVLAWRYAQLLWAMPNRAGEAGQWEAYARHYWGSSGALASQDIEATLGGKGHLKGEGQAGSGVICSVRFRRVLPCLLPSAASST